MAFIKHRCIAVLLISLAAALGLSAQRLGGSYLGLRLSDIDSERAKLLNLSGDQSGVEVADVQPGAAADQAGIRPGDVVLTYNGEKVLGVQQFIRLVSETPPGRRVRILSLRAGVQKELAVITGVPPVFAGSDGTQMRRMQIRDIPSPMMLWRNLALGLESEEINEQLAQTFGVKQGILVWAVTASYPAQRAGLRAGDLLTGFCGRPVRSPRDLGAIMEMQSGQVPLSLEIVRERKTLTISIPLETER